MKPQSRWPRGVVVALMLAACGDQPTAEVPPQPKPAEPGPEQPAPADPAPEDGGGGGAASPEPTGEAPAALPKPSGRPMILITPRTEIKSTFGSTPGAVLKLKADVGEVTLTLPEWALPGTGTNIVFKVMKDKVKSKHPHLGGMAMLETIPADTETPRAVTTKAKDFELRWPTGGKETINLAVGTAPSAESGPGDVSWTIIAPKSVDTSFKEAYFYLSSIGPVQYLHATSAAPTAAPAAAPAPAPPKP
jgi:hypothetical protein